MIANSFKYMTQSAGPTQYTGAQPEVRSGREQWIGLQLTRSKISGFLLKLPKRRHDDTIRCNVGEDFGPGENVIPTFPPSPNLSSPPWSAATVVLVIEIIQVILKLVAAASQPTVGKEAVGVILCE